MTLVDCGFVCMKLNKAGSMAFMHLGKIRWQNVETMQGLPISLGVG